MPNSVERVDPRLLVKSSNLYYVQGLTERAIAEKLSLSRTKVSRLLKQARASGIVRISVVSPPDVFPELEQALEAKYGLRDVVVIEASQPDSQDAVSRDVGGAAAVYLQQSLQDGDVIGVSWGTTLRAMVAALQPQRTKDVRVVQIDGGLGSPDSEVHATELCKQMSSLLRCSLTLLPAPGITKSRQTKEAFLSDRHVVAALELISELSVAYIGIGAPTPTSVVMRDGSIMSHSELADLLARGAVGDIALRFFDAQGCPVVSELDDRVIGITLEQLKRVPHVVGVAGGPEKEAAIRGAVRGGLINVLITDHASATRLLEAPISLEIREVSTCLPPSY